MSRQRSHDMAVNVEMPFHKARELMAAYRNGMPINQPIAEIDNSPPEAPNILVDAFSLGGPADPKQKPLVRHVLVKDLNKVGTRMKLEHPKGGVFSNKAPMGLYCLFDGQSCAGEPGPMAAEFCARNFHTTLLRRLSQLPESPANEASVLTALIGTFADLDQELLANQPDVQDGCGAVVVLIVGERAFVALLGKCTAILGQGEKDGTAPVPIGAGRGLPLGDVHRLKSSGGTILGEGSSARIRHPVSGLLSPVSRSLGDRAWKAGPNGSQALVISQPEVSAVQLRGFDQHPLLLLLASTVAAAMSPQELVDACSDFARQPRAACGAIVARAQESFAGAAAAVQCTAVELCFLPDRPTDGQKTKAGTVGPEPAPVAKKAKLSVAPGGGTKSVRIRHILVKYNDAPQPQKEGDGKKVMRTRHEAEAELRRAIAALRGELRACKKPPKDTTEVVSLTTKKFTELCRELSVCETARKGGHMCGELGWMTPEQLVGMGGSFKEVVEVLTQGQLSDIATSDQGLHLVQRVA